MLPVPQLPVPVCSVCFVEFAAGLAWGLYISHLAQTSLVVIVRDWRPKMAGMVMM